MEKIKKTEANGVERASKYPSSFDTYIVLPVTDKLRQAVNILVRETPTVGRGRRDIPNDALEFDISHLANQEMDSLTARIAYAEGDWINALNDTHITEQAHIKILVTTSVDGFRVTSSPGRIVHTGWHEDVFLARGTESDSSNDELFGDLVAIVDRGIEILYEQKLTPRIRKLGDTAFRGEL